MTGIGSLKAKFYWLLRLDCLLCCYSGKSGSALSSSFTVYHLNLERRKESFCCYPREATSDSNYPWQPGCEV